MSPTTSKKVLDLSSPQSFRDAGLEPTKNKMGFMFFKIGESADHWLESLPHSNKPLLDIGAAYGIHTIHALKNGRDVIALDCDEPHLAELRRRVSAAESHSANGTEKKMGKLSGTIFAKLPSPDALSEGSVSGVLISEVFHFMRPGQPQHVLRDVFRWLEPGGRVVVTTASSLDLEQKLAVDGIRLANGRSLEETQRIMSKPADIQLDAAPGLLTFADGYKFRDKVPGFMYTLSTTEVELMAKRAGFHAERVSYISTGKYPNFSKSELVGETVLLVARKPAEKPLT